MTLIDFLQKHSVDYREAGSHHHVTGPQWIGVDCHLCSKGSGRFRLGIRTDCRAASCWTCGVSNALEALRELTGAGWDELKALRGGDEPAEAPRPRSRLVVPSGAGPLLKAHKLYLRSRGFDPDAVERLWRIGGIGQALNLAWRLYIPIAHQGEAVSWTTRSLFATGTRYVNAKPDQESMPAKHVLFGGDFVRHAVVVCEGPLDAIAIGPGAVATMGMVVTREQIARIAKFPARFVCFDAEPQAQVRAKRLMQELLPHLGTTYNLELESGKDAAEASKKELKQIRNLLE